MPRKYFRIERAGKFRGKFHKLVERKSRPKSVVVEGRKSVPVFAKRVSVEIVFF